MSDTPPFPAVPQTRHRLLRGSSEDHDAFVGMFGELTYDTTNKTARVHDGETLGGFVLSKEGHGHVVSDISDLPDPDVLSAGRFLRVAPAGGYELSDSSVTTTTESIIDASPLGRTLMRAADSHIAREVIGASPVITPGGYEELLTVSGQFTYPRTGLYRRQIQGAGAAGGSAIGTMTTCSIASSGQAGELIEVISYHEQGESVPVIIGAEGQSTVISPNPGGNGGNTTLGDITARGGVGGYGSFSRGDISIMTLPKSNHLGDRGKPASVYAFSSATPFQPAYLNGGSGGNSIFGEGGYVNFAMALGTGAGQNGANATGYGAGGQGSGISTTTTTSRGGNGSPGCVKITLLMGV